MSDNAGNKFDSLKDRLDGIWKRGLKLSFWLAVIAVVLCLFGSLFNGCGRGKSGLGTASSSVCPDAIAWHLSAKNRIIQQRVHKHCLSGLVFSPDISAGKIGIDAPGAVRICLWNNDRCVGWINTENNNSRAPRISEIPEYSAIRLIGDEGVATFYLKK